MLYNNFAKSFGEGVCNIMKNYTEPKLEIVTVKASDVITTSGISFASLFRTSGIEDGGHASLNTFVID